MLSRLWMVVCACWLGFCYWGFGERDWEKFWRGDLETWFMILFPFLLRIVVLFILFGLARPRALAPSGPVVTVAARRTPR